MEGQSATAFFDYQDRARAATRKLAVGLVLGVLAIGLVTHVLISLVVSALVLKSGKEDMWVALRNPYLLVALVGVVALFVGGGVAQRLWQLRSMGGAGVAASLGGRQVDPQTSDPLERRLINVVEEMAIASGLPVPRVFLLPDENGINAFAAGNSRDDAVVAVTWGTLSRLERDELQGVIAHEFSHILNEDVRLNMRMMGVAYGLLGLALCGRMLFHMAYLGGSSSRRSKNEGNGQLALIAVAAIVWAMGWLGHLFALWMQGSISRQREYLADASAVQFTRNGDGIASALRHIGAGGSRIQNSRSLETSHMFMSATARQWPSSHPPLEDRIRKLDPSWDGSWPEPRHIVQRRDYLTRPEVVVQAQEDRAEQAFAHLSKAAILLAGMPEPVRELAHDPWGAQVSLLGLLLDPQDKGMREKQISMVDEPAVQKALRQREQDFCGLALGSHLPLLSMSMPALRQLTDGQKDRLLGWGEALIRADDKVTFLEWCLFLLMRKHLGALPEAPVVLSQSDTETHIKVALSALARVGAEGRGQALEAYTAGLNHLDMAKTMILPSNECRLAQVEEAVLALMGAPDELCHRVVMAARVVASHDGQIMPAEWQLVRLLGDALDVPLPLSSED